MPTKDHVLVHYFVFFLLSFFIFHWIAHINNSNKNKTNPIFSACSRDTEQLSHTQ